MHYHTKLVPIDISNLVAPLDYINHIKTLQRLIKRLNEEQGKGERITHWFLYWFTQIWVTCDLSGQLKPHNALY